MMNVVLVFLMSSVLFSCGDMSLDEGSSDNLFEQRQYATGIKLISTNITNPRAENTMNQSLYTLSSTSRLLVRLEGIDKRTGNAVVDQEKRMFMAISSSDFDENKETYSSKIEVCPISKNWMMLATWERAHPFPTASGRWSQRGGDILEGECIRSDLTYKDPLSNTIYFDVSDWFIYYVKSRGENFGLMVKSSTVINLYGDADLTRGPRFIWQAR